MKLEEYVAAVKKDLDNFMESWVANMLVNPEQYPVEMDEQDWDEQLMVFFMNNGRSES